MANYILDTCTCIAELYFGAEKSGNPKHFQDVKDIQNLFKVVPISSSLLQYAKVRWSLERIGMKIDTMVLLIGSTALCNNMVLVTGNTKHFERFEGLKLENWF